jgi:hypothetical protein
LDQDPAAIDPGSSAAATDLAGSPAAEPSATVRVTPRSSVARSVAPSCVPEVPHRITRSKTSVFRPKEYTDKIKRAFLTSTGDLINLTDALAHEEWKKAMDDEYHALMKNKTWHLVPQD